MVHLSAFCSLSTEVLSLSRALSEISCMEESHSLISCLDFIVLLFYMCSVNRLSNISFPIFRQATTPLGTECNENSSFIIRFTRWRHFNTIDSPTPLFLEQRFSTFQLPQQFSLSTVLIYQGDNSVRGKHDWYKIMSTLNNYLSIFIKKNF